MSAKIKCPNCGREMDSPQATIMHVAHHSSHTYHNPLLGLLGMAVAGVRCLWGNECGGCGQKWKDTTWWDGK